MCLSCGCGEPHATHDDNRHITMPRLQQAAQASDISPRQAAQNILDGLNRAGGERMTDQTTGRHGGSQQTSTQSGGADQLTDRGWSSGQNDPAGESDPGTTPMRRASSGSAGDTDALQPAESRPGGTAAGLTEAESQWKNIGGEHTDPTEMVKTGGSGDALRAPGNPRMEAGNTARETEPGYQDHKHERGVEMPH